MYFYLAIPPEPVLGHSELAWLRLRNFVGYVIDIGKVDLQLLGSKKLLHIPSSQKAPKQIH